MVDWEADGDTQTNGDVSPLVLSRYRLMRSLGYSQHKHTYLAIDEQVSPSSPNHAVVIRQLKISDSTATVKQLLNKQAHHLQQLGKYGSAPCVLDYGWQLPSAEESAWFYTVEEFIAGDNLAVWLEKEKILTEAQVVKVLTDLLAQLSLAHHLEIRHGDIKPANIIRHTDESDRFILVGYGLSDGEQLGCSAEYAAPEQLGEQATHQSDLYSLGVTCLYLLTGIPPFQLYDSTSKQWVWRDYLSCNLSDRFGYVLAKLTERNLRDRFAQANDVLLALGREPPKIPLSLNSLALPWRCLETLSNSAAINSIAICEPSDLQLIASGQADGQIKIWRLDNAQPTLGQPLQQLLEGTQPIHSLAWSRDGKWLAASSAARQIKLWQVNDDGEGVCTYKLAHTFLGHSHSIKALAFHPDRELLASGSWDKTVKIWQVAEGREICTLSAHRLQVNAVAFSPDLQWLATASCDRLIHLWSVNSLFGNEKQFPKYVLGGHNWAVTAIAFSPDSNILASGSDDRTIKLWDANTGNLIRTINGHSWAVASLAFMSDGNTLVSGSWDKTIKLWEVQTGKEIAKLTGHTDAVNAVAIAQKQQIVISGSKDGTISLWQV